ncbi:hypothetical protein NicSoilB8_16340 [Arthrobacter sp. NicSoilB8]|nr:hypothetical protein NicSoilB8_16340 [Arthrobacter sp. NicSoilB8]
MGQAVRGEAVSDEAKWALPGGGRLQDHRPNIENLRELGPVPPTRKELLRPAGLRRTHRRIH